jgi:uncharacterized protein (TIGR02996 family)
VGDPLEETRWLVLADWLQENDSRQANLEQLSHAEEEPPRRATTYAMF